MNDPTDVTPADDAYASKSSEPPRRGTPIPSPSPGAGQEIEGIELARDRGVVVHALIAEIARRLGPDPSPAAIVALARRLLFNSRLKPVYRQSHAQFVITCSAAYFRRFAPSGWTFMDSERVCRGVAFDLLWTRRGHIFADEIKTGIYGADIGASRLQAQASAQAEAGHLEWGSSFLGVRPVALGGTHSSKTIEERDLVHV